MSLSNLRHNMRLQRRVLTAAQREAAAHKLFENFLTLPFISSLQHIAFYWAVDGEINPSQIIAHCWQQQKQCYLPVMQNRKNKELRFAHYQKNTSLKLNRFNIPEPENNPSTWVTAEKMDAILLPLVAFDKKGHRVGMGSGFYDYTLRNKKSNQILIGIAYDFQCVDLLIPNHTDVDLDIVVTEKNIYFCKDL